MILSFSKQQFVDRIKSGVKIHTIREDKHNRWKPGMKIQFWFGNPRNTRSKNKPYHFANGECCDVNRIKLDYAIPEEKNGKSLDFSLSINTELAYMKSYGSMAFEDIAINDGFDNSDEMFAWFSDKLPFDGKLIWFKVTEIIK